MRPNNRERWPITILFLLSSGFPLCSQKNPGGDPTPGQVLESTQADCKELQLPSTPYTVVATNSEYKLPKSVIVNVTDGTFQFKPFPVTRVDHKWKLHVVIPTEDPGFRVQDPASTLTSSFDQTTPWQPKPICIMVPPKPDARQPGSGTQKKQKPPSPDDGDPPTLPKSDGEDERWAPGPADTGLVPVEPQDQQPEAQPSNRKTQIAVTVLAAHGKTPDHDGTVRAASEKTPIQNAAVTVTGFDPASETHGDPITVTSNDKGTYIISLPPFAMYRVSVKAPGMPPLDQWIAGTVHRVTIELAAGKSATAATDPELVPRVEATRRTSFTPTEMTSLPLPRSRSFDSFALLAPGVSPPAPTIDTSGPGLTPGLGTAGQFSVNGLRGRDNSFSIDGSDNNDEDVGVRRQGFLFPSAQPPESINEFQIITALPDVRFGRAIGAQVNAITQSGGNAYHGTIYGFLSDRRLNARNFFDLAPGEVPSFGLSRPSDGAPVFLNGQPLIMPSPVTRATPFTDTHDGFIFGGPAWKMKNTYFFLSFEREDRHASQQANFAVPNVDQRGFGPSFSALLAGQANTYYPASVAGNAIFSLYPFPNNPAGPYGSNTYTAVLPAGGAGYSASAKFDRTVRLLGTDHALSVRYNLSDENSTLPETGGALFSSLNPLIRVQNLAGFLTSSHGKIANSIRLSYGRAAYAFDPASEPSLLPSSFFPQTPFLLNRPLLLNVTTPGGSLQFITGGYGGPWLQLLQALNAGLTADVVSQHLIQQTEPITGPLGEVKLDGFSSVGVDSFDFPQSRLHGTVELGDTSTVLLGRHALTFGLDFWWVHLNSNIARNVRPQADFYGEQLNQVDLCGGSSCAAGQGPNIPVSPTDMVAAGASSALYQTLAANSTSGGSNVLDFSRKQTDIFAQDAVSLTANLRLTFGLRLGLNRLPKGDQLQTAYDPAMLQSEINTAQGGCSGSNASYCQNLIASLTRLLPGGALRYQAVSYDPRIGVAWDVSHHATTILRAGFGRQTGQYPMEIFEYEGRNPIPSYLPLNIANLPAQSFYLFNLANPRACIVLNNSYQCAQGLIQPGTLNILGNETGDPLFFFARELNRLTALVPTSPASTLQNPYSLQYAVTLEHSFSSHIRSSLAYVGTQGRHLLRVNTPDTSNYPGLSFDSIVPLAGTPFPVVQSSDLLPVGLPIISRTLFDTSAASIYNSLQTVIEGSLGGARFGASYTWSHAVDNASDFFDTAGSFALPQDSLAGSERGNSSFDVRQRFTAHLVWPLPFGQSFRPSLFGARFRPFRGWQIAGIYTAQTGFPYTINSQYDLNRDGNPTDRPDTTDGLVFGPFTTGRRTLLALGAGVNPLALMSQRALNADITTCQSEPGYCDGAIGRNTFRAAGMETLDMSLSRSFGFHVKGSEGGATFRVDAFNVANRANFAIPVRILGAPGFGSSVTTSTPSRQIEIGVKLTF
jgi:hypothetical protein